jgi:hypothetical protein
MLVAAVTIGVGLGCVYYGARSLRVGRAVRRLRDRGRDRGPERVNHPTDWPGRTGEDAVESGRTLAERGSIERGFVLLVLGALCLLFGVLAA